MREIKFRGKSVKTGEWVYGYLIKGEHCYILTKDDFYNAVVSIDGHMSTFVDIVIPESVGQYINLHDDKKIEMYEKDIAVMHSENGDWKPKEIKWDKEHGMMMLGNTLVIMSKIEAAEMTVIGNACDNSELVNEK